MLAQHHAARCAVCAFEFEGKADQLVVAGFDVGEVEAFDHPDAGTEHDLMGFDAVFVEAADAEVVHADGHDALIDEILRRVGAEGDEVFVELVHGPASRRIARLEEHPLAAGEPELFEVIRGDLILAVELEDAAAADHRLKRHLLHRHAIGDEVAWRVHVRAGVGAHGEVGQIAHRAVFHAVHAGDLALGIAGPMNHAVP